MIALLSIFAVFLAGSVSIGSSDSEKDDTWTPEHEPNDGESGHEDAIEIDGSAGTGILDFAVVTVLGHSDGGQVSESETDDTSTAEHEPNDGEPGQEDAIEIDGSAGTDILDFPGVTVLGHSNGGQVSGSDGDDILTGVSAVEDQASGITQLVGSGTHVLEGGAGNDLIMIGANDLAYGGPGEDTFLLDGDLGDQAVPEIGDFHSGEDVIIVSLPSNEESLSETWPDRPEFQGIVEITSPTSTGLYGIHIDGNHVANVRSEEEIHAEDVLVLYDAFIGPSQFEIEFGYA